MSATFSRGTSIHQIFGEDCLIPAIEGIGCSRILQAEAKSISPHSHRCMEICLFLRGRTTWWVGDTFYTLEGDSIFLTQPNERHGSASGRLEPCHEFWLHVNTAKLNDRSLVDDLKKIDAHHWKKGARRYAPLIEEMLREHRNPREDSARILEAALHYFLSRFVRERSEPDRGLAHPGLVKVLRNLEKEVGRNVSVEELCGWAGLSKSQLFKVFQDELGVSPHRYMLIRRLGHAQHLLRRTEKSITEIAFETGFNSSQHFAGIFRQYIGDSPGAFRAKATNVG